MDRQHQAGRVGDHAVIGSLVVSNWTHMGDISVECERQALLLQWRAALDHRRANEFLDRVAKGRTTWAPAGVEPQFPHHHLGWVLTTQCGFAADSGRHHPKEKKRGSAKLSLLLRPALSRVRISLQCYPSRCRTVNTVSAGLFQFRISARYFEINRPTIASSPDSCVRGSFGRAIWLG